MAAKWTYFISTLMLVIVLGFSEAVQICTSLDTEGFRHQQDFDCGL